MSTAPHHPRPDPQYFLKYDPDWEMWTLYEHRRNLPDHMLAEFNDGTPEKPPQLAENVLDLLTSPNKKEYTKNEEGTYDQT